MYLPPASLQLAFSRQLLEIREQYLQQALFRAVEAVGVENIDIELRRLVKSEWLTMLAGHGLRGELMFAVPCLLKHDGGLLGYYRLLLGFSQKMFYNGKYGLSIFKSMEEKRVGSPAQKAKLGELSSVLVAGSGTLLEGLASESITRDLLDDLCLLTLGPQLRGKKNVGIGQDSIIVVMEALKRIVQKSTVSVSDRCIVIKNAAKRKGMIEFASDPDITIREEIAPGKYRKVIAIEIKGGTDYSNIHNRLGEAEKSHQNARKAGYSECWTVVNVDGLNDATARQESPSTNRFYRLADIQSRKGAEYSDFRDRVISLLAIRV